MNLLSFKSPDFLGVAAGSLCLVHCLLTPVLFLSQSLMHSSAHGHEEGVPWVWQLVELVFLILSLIAIRKALRHSPLRWLRPAMLGLWAMLAILVVLELVSIHFFGDYPKYAVAIGLIGLHLINHRSGHSHKREIAGD